MADSEGGKTRAELMRLVPLVALEGRRIVEAFAERQGLHQTDVEALSRVMLAEVGGVLLTAGALGRELGLTSGATTFLMNRLERAGLVERARDANDQRKVFLRLSAAGRDLAEMTYPPILRLSDGVMDGFTPAELATVRRFLAAAAAAMATYRASLPSAPHRKDGAAPTGRTDVAPTE